MFVALLIVCSPSENVELGVLVNKERLLKQRPMTMNIEAKLFCDDKPQNSQGKFGSWLPVLHMSCFNTTSAKFSFLFHKTVE